MHVPNVTTPKNVVSTIRRKDLVRITNESSTNPTSTWEPNQKKRGGRLPVRLAWWLAASRKVIHEVDWTWGDFQGDVAMVCRFFHGNPKPSFLGVITHILIYIGGLKHFKTFIFHGFGVQGFPVTFFGMFYIADLFRDFRWIVTSILGDSSILQGHFEEIGGCVFFVWEKKGEDYIHIYTWNPLEPKWPLFWLEFRPCFRGVDLQI